MNNSGIPQTREEAVQFDLEDPFAGLKSAFTLPKGITYLVGHSLGPATHNALSTLRDTAEIEWSEEIVRAWNSADWINLTKTVGAKIAPLIGAKSHEVVVCDSVSVNLFKLAASALPLVKNQQIIIDEDEFPTDQYIAQGLSDISGSGLTRVSKTDGLKCLQSGGVMIKSAVCYRTAEIVDMQTWETEARKTGAVIVWDLSHATGVIPVDLKASNAVLAVGCTYKYLNGGPGAPSYVYVHEDMSSGLSSPIPGWLGHASPFAFERTYRPADHAARFVSGTPGILSLSALSGALDVFQDVDMEASYRKVQGLSELVLNRARSLGLKTTSPLGADTRGGHVSFVHDDGYAVVQALAARNIMADFRTPDTIRFGFSALYLGYAQVWDAMDALKDILESRSWDAPEFKLHAEVT